MMLLNHINIKNQMFHELFKSKLTESDRLYNLRDDELQVGVRVSYNEDLERSPTKLFGQRTECDSHSVEIIEK